jgi:hypothetical protein
MTNPIAEAATRYRLRRARLLDDADQAAQTIRQDLGLPRDRRQWADHAALYNRVQGEVVLKLEQLREQGVADLRAAKAESRRLLYRVQTGPEGGVNRTMALMNYRQAREYAMALPLGEPGFHMAMERMRMAALTGDEQEMAALSLLAEERANGQRGTAWDKVPALWEQHTANKYTREGLRELREADDHLARLAAPDRFSLPKLTPSPPNPNPPPPSPAATTRPPPNEPAAPRRWPEGPSQGAVRVRRPQAGQRRDQHSQTHHQRLGESRRLAADHRPPPGNRATA